MTTEPNLQLAERIAELERRLAVLERCVTEFPAALREAAVDAETVTPIIWPGSKVG